jgi:hypothetical protein
MMREEAEMRRETRDKGTRGSEYMKMFGFGVKIQSKAS